MQKFVVLAERRSGTTLFIDCLNSLPRVHCEKRAFGQDRRRIKNPTKDNHNGMFFLYRKQSIRRRLKYYLLRKSLISQYLDDEIFVRDEQVDIRGFRLIYGKADQHPGILEVLRGTDAKVLHLVRENVLKTHISYMTAPMHKMHHPREGDEVRSVKLRLDPDTIVRELRERVSTIERMRGRIAGMPSMEVIYETFVAERDAEAERIEPFLGMDEVLPFHSDLVKINPDSLADLLENYDEIAERLVGTEFERFLG